MGRSALIPGVNHSPIIRTNRKMISHWELTFPTVTAGSD
jgi:hypothetical protein